MILSIACGGGNNAEGGLRVVATTTQIGDFVRNVAGDHVLLSVLLKPNQDAHDFEPEPSQIRSLADADLVFRNGVGLDAFVHDAVSQSNATVVVVSEGVDLREGAEEHAEEEHGASEDEADGHDPHVWFDVANARIMVENISDALQRADSANAAAYADNARRYLAELDALDAEIKTAIATIPPSCRKLVTNHDVLGYYSEAYGLTFIGSVLESVSSDAQPSAADVADIVTKIKAEKVPAIFAEASINPALIRQVGREAGVRVVDDLYGDSLGPSGSDGATYIGMMRADTRKIVEALKACNA